MAFDIRDNLKIVFLLINLFLLLKMSFDENLSTIPVENNINKLVKMEPFLYKDEQFLKATKSTDNTPSILKVEYSFEDVSCHSVHIKREVHNYDCDEVATAVVHIKEEILFFEHRDGTVTTLKEPDKVPFYAVHIKEERLEDRDNLGVTSLHKLNKKSESCNDKLYVCKICNFKCARNDTLKRHLRTHSNEKPFACDVCEFKCKRRDVLKSHVNNHKGEKPFLCDICRLTFAQRRYLIIHMRTHSGEKPYTCDTCGNKFSHPSTLSNHAKIHFISKTGEKPFSCVICNLKFTRKFTLRRHLRKHHEKQSLPSK